MFRGGILAKKIDKDLIDPAVEPDGEKAHRATRALLGGVPIMGTALVEAFSEIIEPPMARRKTKWMRQVTGAINDLYEKGAITEGALQENEKFFTTLVHASNVALKNHQSEKIEALRNAVINSALPGAPDDSLQQIFLNLVDVCTVWHLAFLSLFQDPNRWAAEHQLPFPDGWNMGGLTQVIEHAFPELRGRSGFYGVIWKDLYQRGLISTDGLGTTMTLQEMLSKRTTGLGDAFVQFISAPNF